MGGWGWQLYVVEWEQVGNGLWYHVQAQSAASPGWSRRMKGSISVVDLKFTFTWASCALSGLPVSKEKYKD